MNRTVLICYILGGLIVGCTAQTNDEKISKTANKVLSAIKNGNEKEFVELIGVEPRQIGKNKELLSHDFEKCKYLYNRYLKNHEVEVLITDEYNELGNRKVIIPFYKGNDRANNTSEARLELYFGPPNFVSLNKLANYKLIIENINPPEIIAAPIKN